MGADLAYAELDLRSNFSFLEGASHADELVLTAKALGLSAIGLADRNSLAGVVRAHVAAKAEGFRLLIGCRLVFLEGTELIVYPRDRAAYGRLCRLLSLGKMGDIHEGAEDQDLDADEDRIAKGDCRLTFEQAVALGEGLIGLVPAPLNLTTKTAGAFEAQMAVWQRAWPDQIYLAAAPLRQGDDRARLNRLAGIAQRTAAPLIATNGVLYHDPSRRPLQDVLACVRQGCRLDEAGLRLQAHAERFLKRPAEMARLFRGHEEALARTMAVVDAARFSLDELQYDYPEEPIPPGKTADQHLADLTWAGADDRYPDGVPAKVQQSLIKELDLIARVNYAPYFLTVHDLVTFARRQAILCQGRGSAANSAVCYCLGITAVDPAQIDLLFERFISEERREPPDIDVDFEHERREEVIQYIYRRYGRHRAAIAATVIRYRPRSAIRDVGKVLGLTEDVTAALANTVWGSHGEGVADEHVRAVGLDPHAPRLALALDLARQLLGFPRHLSQHVGGFILTRGDLVETVPVGNAAMAARTFIEWDKNDIDALKMMKVDVLALGMLSAIRRGFDLIRDAYGRDLCLATVPREDPAVYQMLCQADSVGVFQVESRAQMSMLPRLKPVCFYDLVIQVAIVRPGPIQGDMVHPYLNRRAGREPVAFPSPHPDHGPPDELERVLGKTLGVPLFQEQAMRIAMEAARFTGDEANGLRKAMAAFRRVGTIEFYETMMVERMVERGYGRDFSERCFNQIKGFGDYGFPESHAASFAHLVYVSAWLKRWFPEVFLAALINSQPMGFYAPAQLVRDAVAHGVVVRPPDLNASDWDCHLEEKGTAPAAPTASGRPRRRAVRLGLRQIDGFRRDWALAIMAARGDQPYTDLEDLRRRSGLSGAALDALAAADGLGSLALTRRTGLWAARGLPRAAPAPLFAAMGLEEADGPAPLPPSSASQEVVQDYQTMRLSLKAHPLSFLRQDLGRLGVQTAAQLAVAADGARAISAGVVLVRQRPGSAKGVCFMTLEDETGTVNVVIWPKLFKANRPVAMGARLLLIRGRIQRAEGVVHLVADSLEDRSADLASLSQSSAARPSPHASGHRHPRDVRILPRSRDFH